MRVVLVCALLSLAFVSASAADDDWTSFMSFVRQFNKTYASQDEFMTRFGIFQQNMARVYTYRAQHQLETGESGENVYGVTKFMDLSKEEFKAMYLGFKGTRSSEIDGVPVVQPPADMAAPSTLDWRTKGAVTAVKDQGQCGSCWAFSTTEEIESMTFMSGKPLQTLTVEQIVDCDTVDQGCNGGDTISAYQYVQQAGGLETESDYPYIAGGGESGTCSFDASKVVASITGYTYATPPCTDTCNNQDETTLANNLAATGPVSICVYAEPWQVYVGGVLSSGCSHNYADLDHCVQLVGYNKSTATPYWIIRNSWNTDWGIDGYIYVKIGGNVCGVADEATFATI